MSHRSGGVFYYSADKECFVKNAKRSVMVFSQHSVFYQKIHCNGILRIISGAWINNRFIGFKEGDLKWQRMNAVLCELGNPS
jgi:hypothetical protein